MSPNDLLFVYLSVLRPVLDFAAPTYHSLLSVSQTDTLESLQRKAFKIIYSDLSYREALAVSNVKTLEDRRFELTKNFAIISVQESQILRRVVPEKTKQAL